jgi:hypothetical protein
MKGMKAWYPGYVKGYNEDGTYFIRFDDGDERDRVPENEVELQEPPEGFKLYYDPVPPQYIRYDVELRDLSKELAVVQEQALLTDNSGKATKKAKEEDDSSDEAREVGYVPAKRLDISEARLRDNVSAIFNVCVLTTHRATSPSINLRDSISTLTTTHLRSRRRDSAFPHFSSTERTGRPPWSKRKSSRP